jgi:hypothetical protein
MKSSTSSQHISNSFLLNQQPPIDEETSTYSFRHVTKKLQHAKSHGELYQPHAPLPLPPTTKNDENEIKYRQKYSSDSPQSLSSRKTGTSTTTATVVPIITRPTGNSSDEPLNSSSSQKIPLWKRFKKIIAPTKRNKDHRNSSIKNPILPPNELSTNETNKIFDGESIDIFLYNLQSKDLYIVSIPKH